MLFKFVPFGVDPAAVPHRYPGGADELLLRIAIAAEAIARHAETIHAVRAEALMPAPASLLDVADVARWLGLTPKGVYGLVETGRLPHVKVANRLRFERHVVLRWLAKSRVSPIGDRR